MTVSDTGKTPSRHRVRAHRERMKKKGMRLIQMWVPDLSDPEVLEKIRRDCIAIRNSAGEKEVLEWLDSVHEEMWKNDPWRGADYSE